ncbi:alpha/beta-Hydrolases superfamily protein, partial [Thalictrum thalictroides]
MRGLVVLLHGLNEHSGRYNNFAKQLNANGYTVYGMDWIGHGGSDVLHGYVHSLDAAVSDMREGNRKGPTSSSEHEGPKTPDPK